MSTVAFKDFKEKAFSNYEVKSEYDSLIPAYELRKKLIRLRKQAGFTQEEMANILHTKKSNISRLENVNSKISPKISTIKNYAKAAGYDLEFNFIPISTNKKLMKSEYTSTLVYEDKKRYNLKKNGSAD